MWKLYFTLEINEQYNQENVLHMFYKTVVLKKFFLRTDLRISWNHIMMKFQINHGQCDGIVIRQNIFFWKLSVIIRPLPC